MKALGEKVPTPEKPNKDILETFPNPDVSSVSFYTEEFTSKCPVTGQPDFCSVGIVYTPSFVCLESKSLKLYLQSFRNEAAFVETLTKRIFSDIFDILRPVTLTVEITSKPRGGISLKCRRSI